MARRQTQAGKAQRDYDATPSNPPAAKQRALDNLNSARGRVDTAQANFDRANAELQDLVNRLKDRSGVRWFDLTLCPVNSLS